MSTPPESPPHPGRHLYTPAPRTENKPLLSRINYGAIDVPEYLQVAISSEFDPAILVALVDNARDRMHDNPSLIDRIRTVWPIKRAFESILLRTHDVRFVESIDRTNWFSPRKMRRLERSYRKKTGNASSDPLHA